MRLKPHAIDIRVSVDPVHYFLNDRDDTRSSYYLEDAATEFQVQGLELDWVCVNWDADFRFNGPDWNYHDFRGNRWCNISNADNRVYLRNAYRVCSRARAKVWLCLCRQGTLPIRHGRRRFMTYIRLPAELGISELHLPAIEVNRSNLPIRQIVGKLTAHGGQVTYLQE